MIGVKNTNEWSKTYVPFPKMLNSPADGTSAGGLPGPLAWLVNKSSTRGRTTLLQPSGKETLVPSAGLFNIFGSGPSFFGKETILILLISLEMIFVSVLCCFMLIWWWQWAVLCNFKSCDGKWLLSANVYFVYFLWYGISKDTFYLFKIMQMILPPWSFW